MKTRILLILLVLMCSVTIAQQQLPNNSFENWSQTFLYEGLSVWQSSNGGNIPDNSGVVKSEDSYSGDYSVRLQSLLYNEDTIFSYFYHGYLSGDGPGGGMQYSEDFDGISGYYKCNMAEYDSAVVLVVKFLDSNPTWFFGKLGGIHEDWTYFHFDMPPVICDSVFVGCISGDIFSEYVYDFDSWVMFDSLYFTFSGGEDPDPELIPNYDFEDWQNFYCSNVDDWHSLNSTFSGMGVEPLLQSEDAYDGDYAAELTTYLIMDSYIIPGYLSIGEIYVDDDDPVRKIPYTDKPDKLTGYYKFMPVLDDNGVVQINFTALGETIGGGQYVFTEATEYTYFEVPIEFVGDPDSLLLVFSSGGVEGSNLVLDDISFEFSVSTELDNTPAINIFPNPASNYILV
ncbi:MAG: hypothetical protein PHW83_12640, partial [Bacteroidales bacterium]|nr:hypothetical protein [Bacteroidales bacterium]